MSEREHVTPGEWVRRVREHPLYQLTVTRLVEFYREPEAVFWVYIFPLLMTVGLGIAFRSEPVVRVVIDVVDGPYARGIVTRLQSAEGQTHGPLVGFRFRVRVTPEQEARRRLRVGKTQLVVLPETRPSRGEPHVQLLYDPTRQDSVLARLAISAALTQSTADSPSGRLEDRPLIQPGGRYIDFLVPGLVGMNLLAGGLWGIGYVAVDLRVRNLLKRFLATPMRRSHFLLALMLSRFFFTATEVVLLLIFAYWVFDLVIYGSLWHVAVLLVVGAWSFSGLGLLTASRARTLEAISGLINLVTLPMWLLSGVFFSYERFPEVAHPFIRVLPLTSFNDALRAVMLEGRSLVELPFELANLVLWGLVCFALALRWFRWR